MVYPPKLILYLAIKNYLADKEFEEFKTEIVQKSVRGDLTFLKALKKHFDIELFLTKPYIWQDIWLYNYLTYEVKTKLIRKGLIAKYEREIILPQQKLLDEAKDILGIL
jgi:hypothetical protein